MTEADEMKQYFDSLHNAANVLYERYLANQGNEKVDWDKVRKNIDIGTEAFCTALDSLPATRMSYHEFITMVYSKASDLSIVMYMLEHPLEGTWDKSTLVLIGKLFYTNQRFGTFELYLHSITNLKLSHKERFTIVRTVVDNSYSTSNKLTSEDWATINSFVKGYFKKVNELQLDQHKVLNDIMEYERKNSNE